MGSRTPTSQNRCVGVASTIGPRADRGNTPSDDTRGGTVLAASQREARVIDASSAITQSGTPVATAPPAADTGTGSAASQGTTGGASQGKTGGAPAGDGTGYYVPDDAPVAESRQEPAQIVAFELGTCQGKLMYQRIAWYFPGEGDSFDPKDSRNICTGD